MRLFQVVWDYIQGSLLTTKGDLVKRGAAVNERLGVGAAKEVLGVNDTGDDLVYRKGIEIATTKGDIIKRGAAINARLPVGAAKKVLGVNDTGDDLEYRDGIEIVTTKGDIIKRGAAACTKLSVGTARKVLKVNNAGDDVEYNWVDRLRDVDGYILLAVKILTIGDWDMDTLDSVNVAHGLTFANIKNFTIMIRNDDNDKLYNTGVCHGADTESSSWAYIGSTNITIARLAGGFFDNNTFDATSYNRGWITIWYEI